MTKPTHDNWTKLGSAARDLVAKLRVTGGEIQDGLGAPDRAVDQAGVGGALVREENESPGTAMGETQGAPGSAEIMAPMGVRLGRGSHRRELGSRGNQPRHPVRIAKQDSAFKIVPTNVPACRYGAAGSTLIALMLQGVGPVAVGGG